jgi:Group II intron, maturase-specific domain
MPWPIAPTDEFMGYTFGRCYNHRTAAAYLAASPAKKKIAKLCDAIGEQTSSRRTPLDEKEVVGRLNRKLRGWVNYFDLGSVSRAYSVVNYHVTRSMVLPLRPWQSKEPGTAMQDLNHRATLDSTRSIVCL